MRAIVRFFFFKEKKEKKEKKHCSELSTAFVVEDKTNFEKKGWGGETASQERIHKRFIYTRPNDHTALDHFKVYNCFFFLVIWVLDADCTYTV